MTSLAASDVARVFYNEIICRYGTPRSILTDRGSNFMSQLMKEFCKLFGLKKLATSSLHPQTNATCERHNSYSLQTLRAYCDKDQTNWPDLLPSIMMAYRATPAPNSTLYSPYFILFGREMIRPIDTTMTPSSTDATVQKHLQNIIRNHEITRDIVKENITKAQNKYKQQHDKNAKTPSFYVGQRVWLYEPRKTPGLSPKLCQKWVGPYYICQILHGHTYIIRNCSDNKRVKSPVNAQRLKPYVDPDSRPTNTPTYVDKPLDSEDDNSDHHTANIPQLTQQQHFNVASQPNASQSTPEGANDEWFEVERLLKSKMIRRTRHYLVKWKDSTNKTWEPESNISPALIREFHVQNNLTGKPKRQQTKLPRFLSH